MAAALPAPRDNAPPAEAGISIRKLVMAMAILTVLAGALGAVFAPHPPPEAAASKAASADGDAVDSGPSPTSGLFDLPPVVTNLGAPQDTWVRLETSMIFDPKVVQHPEALAGEIASDLLAYLRTTTLTQIQGPIGLQNLREDLNDRASTRSNGKIKELVIRTLVVQ